MPIVAMVAIDLLDMAVLHLTLAPSQHYSPVGAGVRPDHSISGSPADARILAIGTSFARTMAKSRLLARSLRCRHPPDTEAIAGHS
jgi:hypothetical protein